jgi:peroxiredoxin 5
MPSCEWLSTNGATSFADAHCSMKAWGKSLDESKSSGIRFLADPAGEFTRALDVELEAAKIFGNNRSKRFAVLTENGKITKASVEPDGTGISSMAYRAIRF